MQDSYVKQHFREAYVGALFGVANTIKTYKHWIEQLSPGMWHRMMSYKLSSNVDRQMLKHAMSTQLHVTQSIWNPNKVDANGKQVSETIVRTVPIFLSVTAQDYNSCNGKMCSQRRASSLLANCSRNESSQLVCVGGEAIH